MRRFLFVFIYCLSALSQDLLTQEEKEDEIIDYSNIQKVLKNDGLEEAVKENKNYVQKIKKQKTVISNERYDYPSEEDFWGILSEMWLVKNAQILRWDFPKPNYGIRDAFKQLLEKFGYYNIKFSLLIVNTPIVSHFALPVRENEMIFILSLPFIRSLDLTKVDISLLLLEDYFRIKKKFFQVNMNIEANTIGGNFQKKGLKKDFFVQILQNYSKHIFDDGFNFEQQYLITKEIDLLLKSSPELWNAYFKLYTKIDRFIKSDVLFKNYLKIYPSPELQLKWLTPKQKVI